MSRFMKILLAQLNPIVGDLKGNIAKILASLENARRKGCDLIIFPEMAITGYPPEDLLLHRAFIDKVQECLDLIIKKTQGLSVIIGLPRWNPTKKEKPLHNSAAIIDDCKLLGFHDKCLLPTYDVFDERRYFEPGQKSEVWELRGKKVAVLICEDVWEHSGYVEYTRYAMDPVLTLKEKMPDLLVAVSASPYEFRKKDLRVKIFGEAAKTLQCPVISCCQVGGNDDLIFDGYSFYLDKKGMLRQMAKGFEEEEMLINESDIAEKPFFEYDPLHDLYAALVLGVRDYFHKSGFKKACLGLSGGIDSALVACIVTDALGKENVLAISMPSRYTSEMSIRDARQLAENLGIEFLNIEMEKIFSDYLTLLKPYFQGKEEDVTEENLQSRIRGIILMALSNKLGYIVTCTGNKSESALGYCTLYGDTCGGLGVIFDVTKTQVYALAKFLNRDQERIPHSTIDRPPSAELRPNQKDSDSLPDYAIVDSVLTGYVEDLLAPEEIAARDNIPLETVLDLIERIHKAEYKRRQFPPGIRVSKKAFRIGRRYPIVQKWH
jgi:NAD+ synthase (glutamine-hydrolysing)